MDETYEQALDILIHAPEADAILLVAFFSPEGISSRLLNIVATKNRRYGKPMVVFSLYGPFTDRHLLRFHEKGVAAFGSMSRAVEALVALRERRLFLDRRRSADPSPGNASPDPAREEESARFLREIPPGKKALHEAEAKALMECLGIPVPRHMIFFPEQGEDCAGFSTRSAKAFAGSGMRFPAVLKVLSEEILHKSDVGGVVPGIANAWELARAIEIMERHLEKEAMPQHGILVEEHVDVRVEAIVGALTDPEFGPCVMVGLGGIYSEAFHDAAFRLAPVSALDVEDLLEGLNASRMFGSFRGFDFPRKQFMDLVVRFSRFFHRFSDRIEQMDLNPVAAGPEGLTVLDAKVLLK
jgi:acetyltransferase